MTKIGQVSRVSNTKTVAPNPLEEMREFKKMKKDIHPTNYRLVAFKDMSNEEVFITKSCADTKDTLVVDGVEYPLIKMEISSSSHPFYTGKTKLVDTAGRIDKFRSKYTKKG